MENNTCIICNKNSETIPLMKFTFKGSDYYICSQHVPVLIHNSEQLANILPGMGKINDPDQLIH
ncbi:MAG: hypothetical protein R2771_06800 [Saprospiraceae bacterium]